MPHIRFGATQDLARNLALALTLVVLATACGGTATALPTVLPGTAGVGQASSAAAGSGGPDASALPSGAITDPLVAWPAFAACLRSHGIQVADPELDANGDPQWADDIKKGMTDAISRDCSPILAAITEGGPASNGRRPATYSFDSEVAHAACMREQGLVNWPDPNPNETGGMPEGFDKSDPTVRAALTACESLLVETTASPSPAL
jgi:hypothetical protein